MLKKRAKTYNKEVCRVSYPSHSINYVAEMQQGTMVFITINLQLTSAIMTDFIVPIDFLFWLDA